MQQSDVESLMASCTAEERGGIVYEYVDSADDLFPILARGAVELPALPVAIESRKDEASVTNGGTAEVQAQAQQAPPAVAQT